MDLADCETHESRGSDPLWIGILLVLSNISIVPACIYCFKQQLYFESLIFGWTGLFSSLYHFAICGFAWREWTCYGP